MNQIDVYDEQFQRGQTPVRVITSDRKIIALESQKSNHATPPLSSVAYFDASLKNHTSSSVNPAFTAVRNLERATNSANRRIRLRKPVSVAVYGDMLKISISAHDRGAKDRSSQGGGIRGDVTGFSRASRKRMIEFMAKIRNPGGMMFMTLTFADDTVFGLDEQKTAMFEAFRRRFERAYPSWSALWRIEYQDRKSGLHIGTFVPHFHLLIFTGVHYDKHDLEALSQSFGAWSTTAWHEVTSSADESHLQHGCDISPVHSRKQAYYYVGKYVSKLSSGYQSAGRVWGRIGKFDLSVSETFHLDEEECIVFRRLIKKWLKTRHGTLPENATQKQKSKHKKRLAHCRRYSREFGKNRYGTIGFTVFGLGDTNHAGMMDTLSGYWQFIVEARRQVEDRRERERSHGD